MLRCQQLGRGTGIQGQLLGKLGVWAQLLGRVCTVCMYIYIDVYMYALQQTVILTNQGCEQDEAIGAVCFCASAMCVSLW